MPPGMRWQQDSGISIVRNGIGMNRRQVKHCRKATRQPLLTTPKPAARARENFDILPLPDDALEAINSIQTRQRFNEVIKTGIPGFIAKGN